MDNKKRERSANFTTAETHLLVSLVSKYKGVIENKKTDAVTNKDKENAWRKIEQSFNSCGMTTSVRPWKALKLKYEGIKKGTKKKSSLQRQEMYRTGGGPSNAPDLNEIEEKVLSICSNIKGLEARHDSDTVSITIPADASNPVVDLSQINSPCTAAEEEKENIQANINIPDVGEPFYINEEESQKDLNQAHDMMEEVLTANDNADIVVENKWDKWHPRSLKSRVSNVLKAPVSKKTVTSKLDQLSTARLELVQIQIETAKKQLQYQEQEHELKMEHLANEEKRKQEYHNLMLKKINEK